ncbi:circumsporozoite- and TRAP-related protein [Plasmodium sp. gorilla clade G2]|uniref:circumsporozoite- and TRAP-related protein n=1 Tax=Plasmodium sp. gorilla clade G2 TaxID=880535 RepID=UPI000D21EA6D|nr:circumsporozoite- and TRAP-related protein [Plasmodium sp. gorilla clade G2]SOV10908.1 circumsporozoite- and TRAP-related protein [Plasmodium sp. gorilla clade G2]
MKKAFVLIFSCLLLFLHLHTVRTHYAKNEETNNKDTKLKKKRNSKTFNKKLTNKSFLQVQHTVSTRSVPPPPCLGDDCFCQNYYDLTLILDESASIGSKNWKNHVIPFTDKIINDLTISKNEVHVGILLFSSKNRDYVTYGDELRYQKDELLKKVEKLKKDYYCGGGTKILGALKYSLENYTKHKNVRYNAPKVTILFTDGNENSASNKQLLEMGLTYRRERVKLLVLGVAAAEDKKLKLIAGCEENTNCPYSMKAEWETINDITKRLTNKICHTESEIEPEPQPEPSTPTTHCQGDDCFCEDYYDLTLILDESRSITLNKWKNDVVPFAEKVLNNLNIDKDKIHVGIMRFAKSMKTDTGYEQETRYMKNDLIKLVRDLKNKYGSGGATHLVDALQYSLKTFTRHPNNRVDAPKVTILFTDGNETSKKEKDIRDIGLLYRKENVKLIVVGVNLATEKSLKLLAGCTENEECLRVIKCEWNDLTNITKILTDKICNTGSVELPKPEENPEPVEKPNPEENPNPVEKPNPEENPNPVEKPNPEENPNPVEKPEPEKNPCINMEDCYCKDFYDLTLVLDESASISDLIWKNEVIPFALEIIKRINISYKNVHMGVLLFSEYTRDVVRFYDNARYEKGTLQTKINDLKRDYRSGKKTYITQALRYALTYYSKLSNRKEAPKVTMLFTDGNDSNESEKGLNDIALLYRKEHVKLLVVGVSTASENKLKMLVGCATNVVCPFVIKTEWGLLKSVSEVFVKKICDTGVVLPPGSPSESNPGNPSESSPGNPSESSPGSPSESTPGNPSESSPGSPSESTPSCSGTECLCHNTYDLTLIIDESASIGYSNWEKEVVPFTVGIASNLEISEKKVNMGILLFSDKIREFIKYGQKESYDKINLVRRIHDLKKYYKSGGFSYIVEALKYGLYSYAKSTSTRLDVPKVNILLTDGNNTNTSDFILTEVSSLYKKENVKLLLIGIGGPTIHKLRLLGGCDKSDGDCPYVVKAEWNNLKYTSNLIINKICHTDTPVEKPGDSSSVCNSKDDCICKNYFDLTYIEVPTLNSTYTWKSEFMDCSKNIMNSFVIDKNQVHVSLIISLEKKSVHQGFDDVNSYNKNELVKTLGKLENSMVLNKTNILDSLVYGIQQSFGKGHRENAPKVTILLTNSNSDLSDEKALQDIYLNYKERSIKLLIIGIGITNKEKLLHAGGCNMNGNNCPHVYASKSFSYIGGVDTFLEVNKCDNSSSSDNNGGDNGNGTEGNVNPDTPSCNDNDDDDKCNNDDSNIICTKVLDIAVVLDQSSNISKDQWNVYVKQFVINTVNQNYLSKYRSHITIVKMGKSTKEKWSLNKKISYQKKKIIKKINKLPISYSKKKDIAKSLKYVRTKVFKKSETNRKKLIIMLVEGKSNSNMNDLRKEVGLLKVNNIDFFAYAIDNIDQTEYKILGDCESSVDMGIMGNSPSSPSYLPCKNIVKVSWDTLLSSTDIHMKYICNGYPEDAECSEWEEWSPCPENCPTINNNNNNNRTYFPHLSKRERKGPYTLKGEEYMGEKYGSSCMELKSIEYRSCPINAGCNDMCGDFGEWSECSATCGEGIRVRNRDNSLDNDDKCKLFNSTEMEACNIQECDDNNNVDICEDIGEWSDWSSCSKTCGYSTRSRTFSILPEYIGEYPNCKTFERSETEVCAFIPACSDETCFEWEEWNEWSSPCSPRKRVQKARVLKNNGVINSSGDNNNNNNNNAKRGMEHTHSTFTSYNNKKSDLCEEEVRHYLNKVEYDEESTCENKNPCGDWSDWSECDRTCNVGVRIRHFISHMFDMVSDEDEKECLEYYNKVETEDCLHLPPCDGGECSDWETWVECKEEDMIGNNCHKPNKKILTRKLELLKNKDITRSKNTSDVCNDYTLFREEDCPQLNDTCINALCNEWEEWGDCSSTCGEGSFKIRKRKAPLELIPASQDINGNIGLTCAQQNIKVEEREACIVPACEDESTNGGTVVDGSTTPSSPSDSNNNDGSSGNNTGDSNDKKGMGTGEKVSIAAGVIGLVALAAGGLIYGYNTLNGGEPPHSSNMEFENVENNTGAEEQENEDFEVVDADDPMWN